LRTRRVGRRLFGHRWRPVLERERQREKASGPTELLWRQERRKRAVANLIRLACRVVMVERARWTSRDSIGRSAGGLPCQSRAPSMTDLDEEGTYSATRYRVNHFYRGLFQERRSLGALLSRPLLKTREHPRRTYSFTSTSNLSSTDSLLPSSTPLSVLSFHTFPHATVALSLPQSYVRTGLRLDSRVSRTSVRATAWIASFPFPSLEEGVSLIHPWVL
jgi:hypothetical protein